MWTTLHRITADHGRGPDAPSTCNTSVYMKDSTTAQWGNLMVVGSIPTSGVLHYPVESTYASSVFLSSNFKPFEVSVLSQTFLILS